MDLTLVCRDAVGHRVRFKGTNGNEYSDFHGISIEGEGYCTAYHNSHGLCIIVKTDDDKEFCVDPIEVTILDKPNEAITIPASPTWLNEL